MKRPLLTAVAVMCAATCVDAQWNVARFDSAGARAWLTGGLDPAVIASVGFAGVVRPNGHAVQLGVEGTLGGGTFDVGDYRLRILGTSSMLQLGAFRLATSAAFVTRGTRNTVYRATNMGADVGATVGHYRPRWFLAAEGGFDKAIVTHVAFTRTYREVHHPEARSGWYVDTGGNWRYGVMSGVTIGRTEFVVRAGIPRTEGNRSLVVPAYLTVGIGRRYP
ncbi:MAG: hypothetical protein JNJ98_03390 [Gemmatimonadetes bacterium]|nr:hypothetical protein [Gemmatimonadota bacterium]